MEISDGYCSGCMKKHRSTREQILDPIAEMAATVGKTVSERTWMNKELLQALALAVAANEKAQRRFRTAVLIRLSRIETIVEMIHGAQIVESHISKPGYEEKVREHAKDAEKYISQHSNELGLKMVKYVYEEPGEPGPRRSRQRNEPNWEI